VALLGDEEIRVYSILDDKKLTFNSVSVSIDSQSTNYFLHYLVFSVRLDIVEVPCLSFAGIVSK